jgi:hypothetical protein
MKLLTGSVVFFSPLPREGLGVGVFGPSSSSSGRASAHRPDSPLFWPLASALHWPKKGGRGVLKLAYCRFAIGMTEHLPSSVRSQLADYPEHEAGRL